VIDSPDSGGFTEEDTYITLKYGRCGCGNKADPDHPCPYASDIDNDDTTMCNCCSNCSQECANDI
jgi:hypothetical protein